MTLSGGETSAASAESARTKTSAKTNNPGRSSSSTSVRALAAAVLVASLAVAVRALNPEILLRVPRVGFVLYFLLGGVPIPPFFESTMFERDEEWLRPGDVVVSAGVKSGTTWLVETVNLIRTRGRVTNTSDIFLDAPWAEFKRFPGETRAQRISYFRSVAERFPFAVYKTHYFPPKLMPRIRDDVRYILSFRNPFDAVSSFVTFGENYSPAFRDWWGGFPPVQADDIDSIERAVLVDKGDGKSGFFEDLLLEHVRGFWSHRRSPNVLWLNYADRIRDPAGDVDKIAKFLGIELTPDEKRSVLEHSSFAAMKRNDHRFRFCGIFDEPRRYGRVPDTFDCMFTDFVAKGPARKGVDELRPKTKELLLRMCHEHLGQDVCAWLARGGPLPDVDIPDAPAARRA